jgi:hypothetical protein
VPSHTTPPGSDRRSWFLLPHERWLVPRIRGPDGMIWLDASLANVPFAIICAVAVFVIVFAHPTRTSKIGGYLLLAVAVFWVLYIIRRLQAGRAGRKFRRNEISR